MKFFKKIGSEIGEAALMPLFWILLIVWLVSSDKNKK